MAVSMVVAVGAGVCTAAAAMLLGAGPDGPAGAPAPSAASSAAAPPAGPGGPATAPPPSPSMPPPSAGVSPAAGWGAVNCAEIPFRAAGAVTADDGGVLVPSGATTVTRCQRSVRPARNPGGRATGNPRGTPDPGGRGAVDPPQVLTTHVEEFVALLDALPPVPVDQRCLPVTPPVQLSFVFTFPRAAPLVVYVDPACGALVTLTQAKSYALLNPLPVFDALYRKPPG